MSRYDYDPLAVQTRGSLGCLGIFVCAGVLLVWWWTSWNVQTPWKSTSPTPPRIDAAPAPISISIPDPDAAAVQRARKKLGLRDGQPLQPPMPPPAQAKP